jgi:two-component system, NtrC family, response regulator HydG
MKALIVDDDSTLRLVLRSVLEKKGFKVLEAEDGQMAVDMVQKNPEIGVAILDVNMPRLNGLEALAKIKAINPSIFCIIATAYSNMNDAITAIKHGAYDYLQKPVDPERLLKLLDKATTANNLVLEASYTAPKLAFDEGRTIVGGSSQLIQVFDVIYKLAKVDTSVLIRGESGTGKELVARALHFNSHRKHGPFVALNCAAIPESLIESELFGHEKGAFTGADKRKIGKFAQAEGGTLFLDEIGDISAATQVKLLRVLQERVYSTVGGEQEIKADVRIVAATHKPLEKMIANNEFRADLFFRLNVLPINLPPLRDRKDDIHDLCQYLVRKFNKAHKRKINGISDEAMRMLMNHSWPGNIRELENAMERAFIMESSNILQPSSFDLAASSQGSMVPGYAGQQPEPHKDASAPRQAAYADEVALLRKSESDTSAQSRYSDADELNFPAMKDRFEREFIIKALKAYKGRINQTAEATQMTKVTLLRKLEKYGIDAKDYFKL